LSFGGAGLGRFRPVAAVLRMLIALFSLRSQAVKPLLELSLPLHSSESIPVKPRHSAVFFFQPKARNATYHLAYPNPDSSLQTVTSQPRFLRFSGAKLDVHTNEHPLRVKVWEFPDSLCPGTSYALSANGQLSADFTDLDPGGPLCLFPNPFGTRHHMVSTFQYERGSSNISLEYYVDSVTKPYSDCDPGVECVFWHMRPFVFRISAPNVRIAMNLKYESKVDLDTECLVKEIPDIGAEKPGKGGRVKFACEDRAELRADQFKLIFVMAFALVMLLVLLLFCRVIDLGTILGNRTIEARFSEIQVELLESPRGDKPGGKQVQEAEWDFPKNVDDS
jgi:hypothetical protein